MAAHVTRCPNCGATLAPGPFASRTTCEYCGSDVRLDPTAAAAVSAARFHAALRAWREAGADDPRPSLSIAGERWLLGPLVAHGEVADVHYAERMRRPTERALVKVLRDEADGPLLAAEWKVLRALTASKALGADDLVHRLPAPVAHGRVEGGPHAGALATVLRYVPGFDHTLEAVRAAYPGGVDPHIGVWMWRRLLEVLSFLHRSGVVHGAVLPQHLLVERGEHGLRLVGYGCAGRPGAPLAAIAVRHQALYPPRQLAEPVLRPVHDLAQAARSVAHALGADDRGRLPAAVPEGLAALLTEAADGAAGEDAWALHSRVGALARQAFGPPSFHPLALPPVASASPPGALDRA